jgi:hypothetical protein
MTAAIATSVLVSTAAFAQGAKQMTQLEVTQAIIKATKPLPSPRGKRLPIRTMSLESLGTSDDAPAEGLLRDLDARGLAVSARWDPGDPEGSLAESLRVGRLQRKLGLEIGVNASACMHAFFIGDVSTAHVADDGTPFFDDSFGAGSKMGCPFTLKPRYAAIKAQFGPFLKAYQEAGLTLDFIYLDWEIDGPIEWNGAWEHSKRCRRCRESIPDIGDFTVFQKVLRTIRCELEREVYADTVKAYFPQALIGNYAVYPNDGYRYWYDYFEQPPPAGAPYRLDQRAKYRRWFQEFPLTGFTFAMPVVYTWYPTFGWYDFEDADYRWFYNMLLVATNAAKSTPASIPVVSWLHWHTTSPPENPDPNVKQFSEGKYQELVWHMLLRGIDGLMMWCMPEETAKETQLIQEVYAASLEYKEFLERGTPVCFDVPTQPGPVVSGLRLGSRLLVRRTDFGGEPGEVVIRVNGTDVKVPKADGRCQVIPMPR